MAADSIKGMPALYTSVTVITALKANQAGSLQPTTRLLRCGHPPLFDTRDGALLMIMVLTLKLSAPRPGETICVR